MRILLRCLLPPLLGVTGFVIGREMTRQAPVVSGVVQKKESEQARLLTYQDLQRDLENLREERNRQDDREAEEIGSLSPAALRAKIEGLLKKAGSFNDDTDWPIVEATETALFRAIFELGKKDGEAALRWIEEKSPGHRGQVTAGWSEADPDAALRAVLLSKRKPPCFPETLMSLLQHRASDGAMALREACEEVPWELVLANIQDPFREGLQLPSGADVRPWIESGAAEAMARDGIAIPGLFTEWAAVDPDQALERVQSWEDPRNPFPMLVHDLLRAGVDREDRQESISRALEALTHEQLTRIAAGLTEFGERSPGRQRQLLELYPILKPTTPHELE